MLNYSFFNKYISFIKILFFVFLLGVLSFGRAFSIVNLKIESTPLFVTEIFLLCSAPLIAAKIKKIIKIAPLFSGLMFAYVILGLLHLIYSFPAAGFFALRDFTFLCAYSLFLPVVVVCIDNLKALKASVYIIVFANIIAIGIGSLLIFGGPKVEAYGFVSNAKSFQIGMVYGISSIFLLTLYNFFDRKFLRLLILCLVSLNLYMIVILSVRSLWLAVILSAIFLMFLNGFKSTIRVYLKLLISFLMIGSLLFCFCMLTSKTRYLDNFINKGKSLFYVLDIVSGNSSNLNRGSLSETGQVGYDNIVWREKIWKQTLNFAGDSFLFGKGFGNYPEYDIWGVGKRPCNPFTDSKITPTHNYLLTVFYKTGIVGLTLFFSINLFVFYYALKHLKTCKNVFVAIIVKSSLSVLLLWYVMALFFDVIDSPPTSILLWIFIGLIFAAVKVDHPETSLGHKSSQPKVHIKNED